VAGGRGQDLESKCSLALHISIEAHHTSGLQVCYVQHCTTSVNLTNSGPQWQGQEHDL